MSIWRTILGLEHAPRLGWLVVAAGSVFTVLSRMAEQLSLSRILANFLLNWTTLTRNAWTWLTNLSPIEFELAASQQDVLTLGFFSLLAVAYSVIIKARMLRIEDVLTAPGLTLGQRIQVLAIAQLSVILLVGLFLYPHVIELISWLFREEGGGIRRKFAVACFLASAVVVATGWNIWVLDLSSRNLTRTFRDDQKRGDSPPLPAAYVIAFPVSVVILATLLGLELSRMATLDLTALTGIAASIAISYVGYHAVVLSTNVNWTSAPRIAIIAASIVVIDLAVRPLQPFIDRMTSESEGVFNDAAHLQIFVIVRSPPQRKHSHDIVSRHPPQVPPSFGGDQHWLSSPYGTQSISLIAPQADFAPLFRQTIIRSDL